VRRVFFRDNIMILTNSWDIRVCFNPRNGVFNIFKRFFLINCSTGLLETELKLFFLTFFDDLLSSSPYKVRQRKFLLFVEFDPPEDFITLFDQTLIHHDRLVIIVRILIFNLLFQVFNELLHLLLQNYFLTRSQLSLKRIRSFRNNQSFLFLKLLNPHCVWVSY
jgi:hypothetical protein